LILLTYWAQMYLANLLLHPEINEGIEVFARFWSLGAKSRKPLKSANQGAWNLADGDDIGFSKSQIMTANSLEYLTEGRSRNLILNI